MPRKRPSLLPSKGKAKVKITKDGKKVSFGQKGADVKPMIVTGKQ